MVGENEDVEILDDDVSFKGSLDDEIWLVEDDEFEEVKDYKSEGEFNLEKDSLPMHCPNNEAEIAIDLEEEMSSKGKTFTTDPNEILVPEMQLNDCETVGVAELYDEQQSEHNLSNEHVSDAAQVLNQLVTQASNDSHALYLDGSCKIASVISVELEEKPVLYGQSEREAEVASTKRGLTNGIPNVPIEAASSKRGLPNVPIEPGTELRKETDEASTKGLLNLDVYTVTDQMSHTSTNGACSNQTLGTDSAKEMEEALQEGLPNDLAINMTKLFETTPLVCKDKSERVVRDALVEVACTNQALHDGPIEPGNTKEALKEGLPNDFEVQEVTDLMVTTTSAFKDQLEKNEWVTPRRGLHDETGEAFKKEMGVVSMEGLPNAPDAINEDRLVETKRSRKRQNSAGEVERGNRPETIPEKADKAAKSASDAQLHPERKGNLDLGNFNPRGCHIL